MQGCVIVKCTTVQLCLIIIWNYLAIHHCVMQCECIILQISWLVLDSLQKIETPCFAVAWLFYFSILAQRSTCDFQTYPVWPRDLHGQQGRCYFLNFVSGKVLANGNLQGVVKTWNWMPWDPQMDWSFLRLKGLKFLFPSNSKNSFHGFLRVRVTCFFCGKFHLQ